VSNALSLYPQDNTAAPRASAAPLLARGAAAFGAAGATLAAAMIAPALGLLCAACALALVLARFGVRIDRRAALTLCGPAFGAACAGATWGLDAAIGLLFAWRVVADARWSADEGRRLARLASGAVDSGMRRLHYFATPALGIAVVAYSAPHVLLGLPLDLPHVPLIAPLCVGAIAVFALFDWGVRRLADWRLGAANGASVRHALAHHALFAAAFVFSGDVSAGVLALIVWRAATRLAQPSLAQPSFTAVP